MTATLIEPETMKTSPVIEELPILPVREGTLFPRAALPFTIGRPESVALILSLGEGQRLGVIAQKDPRQEQPQPGPPGQTNAES